MADKPPPPKGGLSLYDNLLDPNDTSSSTTISSAPVRYNRDKDAAVPTAKKPLDAFLRFQPIPRPQIKQAKPKPSVPKAAPKPTVSNTDSTSTSNTASAPNQPPKSSLADWAATEEDEWMYGTGEKRQRGGRKKKKHQVQAETDWDELYDPSRPTNVEEYLRSDEKIQEVREWKALLYKHRRRPQDSDLSDDSAEEDDKPAQFNQFAPPPTYASVPPPSELQLQPSPDVTTGEDAYSRRAAIISVKPPSQTPASITTSNDRIHPLSSTANDPAIASDPTVISRAPVRYKRPVDEEHSNDASPSPASETGPETDAPEAQPRSQRPGQAGFAQRFMSKYGWTKGTGLGANESGIINPLSVKVDKRRKKADADGGGWAEPGGKGKILGGRRNQEDKGKFGIMSEVILLRNMLENLPDLQAEVADGLGQEIGEECGEKYGRVERLYIDQENRQVFIKFTNQISALRAVNELDGRVFNGNKIAPTFYNVERFEMAEYGDMLEQIQ